MVNPQKAEALNKRATGASKAMRQWSKLLFAALKEQTPSRDMGTGSSQFAPDSIPETITLRGLDVDNMAYELRRWANEIDEFAWRPK